MARFSSPEHDPAKDPGVLDAIDQAHRVGDHATANRLREQAAAVSQQPRTNKYAADCANCHQRVQAGEGVLTKGDNAWVVTHVQPCPDAPADAPAPANYNEILTKGTYTVVLDGQPDTTIRIVRQAEDDDFMPGLLVIGYLSGPNNERDYTNFANVRANGLPNVWTKFRDNTRLNDAMRVLVGNIPAAREAYAVESSRCSYCNRKLTVKASIFQGLGPECAKKV